MSNILVEQKCICTCRAEIIVVLSILWSEVLYSYSAVVCLICMTLHLCCVQFIYYRWWCIWWTTLVTFPWELELPAYHLWLWNMMMCLASQQMSWVLKFFLLQIYRLGQGWWIVGASAKFGISLVGHQSLQVLPLNCSLRYFWNHFITLVVFSAVLELLKENICMGLHKLAVLCCFITLL